MVYSFSHWLHNVKGLMPTAIDTFWKLYWYRNDM